MNAPIVKEAVDIIVIISGLMIIVIGAVLKNQKLLYLLGQIIQKFLSVEHQNLSTGILQERNNET